MIEKDLFRRYIEVYEQQPEQLFFAPGRINLIGEHIDYNGGYVFPCAITYGTYAYVKRREDRLVRFYSDNFEEVGIIEVHLDDLKKDPQQEWANYTIGVLKIFADANHFCKTGFDVFYYGNIPYGAGLSSSASIEMATAWMINTLFEFNLSKVSCALLCKKVENEFIGVNSGIMDQFIIGMGKKDQAVLLDTSTLDYTEVPVELENMSIVIMNTNKKRGLADSKYNERYGECQEALRRIKEVNPDLMNLCELTPYDLTYIRPIIDNDRLYRRAKHAILENDRTVRAANLLKEGNVHAFGRLMNESHRSLQFDYEATGVELDTLVETAWQLPQTIGARVTGAGFGGCAIAIVKDDGIEEFIQMVGKIYENKIGYVADFYVAHIGDGTKEIELREVA